eukprot:TRINITY_DN1075_c0_g2_i1.p1 TRINITY_DN1075_c0_g2~~TRINITY_DN1075_c0_g2_i1.p1  ORF type:complete len:377 (-),score=84.74 TRINITY_DN1075_c0_g2_i1:398-1528(-)
MVAERELCTVVEVAYNSFSIEKEIDCKVDDAAQLAIIPDLIAEGPESELELKAKNLVSNNSTESKKEEFVPIIRSGSFAVIGHRNKMEDEHICIDDLSEHFGSNFEGPKPNAFYGVFDGHGGAAAAAFARDHLLKYIVEDSEFLPVLKQDVNFNMAAEKALKNAFMEADLALAEDNDVDSWCGTTVLTALILGRCLFVANAGDCRAVLSRRGKAVAMSQDHKPERASERLRIEASGGFVYDGYLNGELSVARALGDWAMKLTKDCVSPLIAEPEIHQAYLTEEDEILIIACDGIWDVLSSQKAVDIARNSLIHHNDPVESCKDLVSEVLAQADCDNLTVVVICFSGEPPPRLERPKRRFKLTAEGFRSLQCLLEGV